MFEKIFIWLLCGSCCYVVHIALLSRGLGIFHVGSEKKSQMVEGAVKYLGMVADAILPDEIV